MELETEVKIMGLAVEGRKYAVPEANITTADKVTVDRKEGSFLANVNKDEGRSWRMVYTDKEILCCFESTGYTGTVNNLFVAETKQDCIEKAAKLGMEIPQDPRQSGGKPTDAVKVDDALLPPNEKLTV